MEKSTIVKISKWASKQLVKIPVPIKEILYVWINTVEEIGIQNTRRLKGYHDEPLKGKRLGQRSIRLNRSYRAIYQEHIDECLTITVIEVTKHDY